MVFKIMNFASRECVIVSIIILVAIFIIIYAEYVAHDCVPHKTCTHSVEAPSPDDDRNTYIDKISDMITNNNDYVAWRQSLLVSLIVTIPIAYYARKRLPNFTDAIIIIPIVFIATYFSWSWIWSHFFNPNSIAIHESLDRLKDPDF